MPLYLTTVWPYDVAQEEVTPEQQVEDLAELHERGGYKAFKIRIWRKDTSEDVRTVKLFKERLPHCEIMLDRTGDGCGRDWTHEEALEVAKALKDAGATWLEECFRRDFSVEGVTSECVARNAALTQMSPLTITGGEHQPITVYHDYLAANAFDIVQPHCANMLSDLRKIAGAAELAGMGCIFHGHHGMDLIGSLQVEATIPSARMKEIVRNWLARNLPRTEPPAVSLCLCLLNFFATILIAARPIDDCRCSQLPASYRKRPGHH